MWTWLIIAGVLIVLEMLTGTFAMLFAGGGALLAALLVFLGIDSLTLEVGVFAMGSLLGMVVAAKHLGKKNKLPPALAPESQGQTVVAVGLPNAHGDLRVRYRGSEWSGRLLHRDMPVKEGDLLVIVGQEGSILILDQVD